MLKKKCARCNKIINYGIRYCPECSRAREAEEVELKRKRDRRYDKTRDKKYIRFYKSKEWQMIAKKRLADDNYRCVVCGNIASDVDHISPIQTSNGWLKRYDYSNTQSLCVKCHNAKHERF